MSTWILGIDAGGTRTRVALASADGETLRTAAAGPCNWTTLPAEACLASIDEAAGAVLPGNAGHEVAAACVCSAGYFPAHHEESVRTTLRERWPNAALRLETDLVAAWAGALGAEPGIVVVAGTGSVAYGRLADGREARAGGWGPLFDDQGSAYWLACRAMGTVAAAVDGRGPATVLGEFLRPGDDFPVEDALWLREFLRRQPDREAIAALAPRVLAASEWGDTVARNVVEIAAASLAHMVRAVERRLAAADSLCWSWSGGLLQGSSVFRDQVREILEMGGSRLRMVPPRTSGEHGALLLAEQLVGQTALRSRLLDAGLDEP